MLQCNTTESSVPSVPDLATYFGKRRFLGLCDVDEDVAGLRGREDVRGNDMLDELVRGHGEEPHVREEGLDLLPKVIGVGASGSQTMASPEEER